MNEHASRGRILIVDDDRTVLQLLGTVLARDYAVTMTDNAVDAVHAVEDKRPDVIICDVRMPGHDGFWVMTEVRKIDPSIPVILHSAYQDAYSNDDVSMVFRPFAFLTKGASLREVRQVVSDALKAGTTNPR